MSGVETGYDVLHVSGGNFRGYAAGHDLQDSSEIGALKHDCWTCWGHSGGPLVDQRTERLVGLRSSWGEEPGRRRGVPLEAVKEFLTKNSGVYNQLLAPSDSHSQPSAEQPICNPACITPSHVLSLHETIRTLAEDKSHRLQRDGENRHPSNGDL